MRDEDCSGIYEVSCKDCEETYIGQTRRKIKVRGGEHRRNTKNREIEKSAVAKHHWENKHQIDFRPKLVKKVSDRRKLNVEERISIFKRIDSVFNTDLEGLDNKLFTLIDRKKEDKLDNRKKEDKLDNVASTVSRPQSPQSPPPVSAVIVNNNKADSCNYSRYNLRPRKVVASHQLKRKGR